MEPTTAQIPTSVYTILGILVVSNLGTLFTAMTMLFKAGMFVKETQMGIESARATAVRAHKRIDKISGESDGE